MAKVWFGFIIGFITILNPLVASNNQIDSLKNLLTSDKSDTKTKLSVLTQLSNNYIKSKIDSAYFYNRQARSLINSIDAPETFATILDQKISIALRFGNDALAM